MLYRASTRIHLNDLGNRKWTRLGIWSARSLHSASSLKTVSRELASSDIMTVVRSRRIRWAGHIARIGVPRNAYNKFENLKGRDNLEDPGIDGRIILEY
jgi:hypothetical protein